MLQEIIIKNEDPYGNGEIGVKELTHDTVYQAVISHFGTQVIHEAVLKDKNFIAKIKKEYDIDIKKNIKLNEKLEFTTESIIVRDDSGFRDYQTLKDWERSALHRKMPTIYAPIDNKLFKEMYPAEYKQIQEYIEKNKAKQTEKQKKVEAKKIAQAKKTLEKAGLKVE